MTSNFELVIIAPGVAVPIPTFVAELKIVPSSRVTPFHLGTKPEVKFPTCGSIS